MTQFNPFCFGYASTEIFFDACRGFRRSMAQASCHTAAMRIYDNAGNTVDLAGDQIGYFPSDTRKPDKLIDVRRDLSVIIVQNHTR